MIKIEIAFSQIKSSTVFMQTEMKVYTTKQCYLKGDFNLILLKE